MTEIGSLLREARTRERIDITTVESATKIRAKYLRALENEEWDQLPGPTFVRTFLRTYAEYLGLDSKMLVEEYKQRFERPTPQDVLPFSTRAGGGRRPPRPPRIIPPWVVLGAFVVLLLGALFALGTLGDDDAPETEAVATPTATREPAGRAGRRREREPRPEPEPKVVRVKFLPEAAVYICLETAAGERLIGGEVLTDPTDTFKAKRMRVTFGNGLVVMRVDDEEIEIEDRDEPIGFELAVGREPRELAAEEQPTCT